MRICTVVYIRIPCANGLRDCQSYGQPLSQARPTHVRPSGSSIIRPRSSSFCSLILVHGAVPTIVRFCHTSVGACHTPHHTTRASVLLPDESHDAPIVHPLYTLLWLSLSIHRPAPPPLIVSDRVLTGRPMWLNRTGQLPIVLICAGGLNSPRTEPQQCPLPHQAAGLRGQPPRPAAVCKCTSAPKAKILH